MKIHDWAREHPLELLCTLGPPILVLLVRGLGNDTVLYGLLAWAACPGLLLVAPIAYRVSCRVADREGQPWAWLSFWLVVGSYLGSVWMMFVLGPPMRK